MWGKKLNSYVNIYGQDILKCCWIQ